uniref:Uncharacterized protein n=1 Tax=Romanomermis culicivorax TaxID=13658 RepID=A0A915J2E7_ROMCU
MLTGESPSKTPTQAPADTELNKETAMAIESLIKDITEESFAIKMDVPTESNIIQIKSDQEDVSQTDTTAPTTMAKATSSLTLLSKNLSYNWGKGEEFRAKAVLTKTILMRNILGIDDDDSKMVPLQIIPARHKIAMSHKRETSTPDYLEAHSEDPNYVPPPKKPGDWLEETKSKEQKETEP